MAHSFLLHAATQSAVLAHIIVLLSVCDVEVLWSHTLEYFNNNFMADWPRVFTSLIQREHREILAAKIVGYGKGGFQRTISNISKMEQNRAKVTTDCLWSHTWSVG